MSRQTNFFLFWASILISMESQRASECKWLLMVRAMPKPIGGLMVTGLPESGPGERLESLWRLATEDQRPKTEDWRQKTEHRRQKSVVWSRPVNPLTLLAESGQPLVKGATPLSSSMLRACQKGGHTHGQKSSRQIFNVDRKI